MHVVMVHLHVTLQRWHKAVCIAHVWQETSALGWRRTHCWHRVHVPLLLLVCSILWVKGIEELC